jgi:mRNA-degrading endonuclease toxin of MazEF toxin-antitoxin module
LYSKSFNDLNEKILHHDNLVSFVRWTYEKYKYGIRQQKSIFQWDIFYCDLGHNIGSEKNKTRPVIIVQRTIGFLNADTIMVAPITIGEDFDKLYKHEVVIDRTLRGKIKGKIDLSHIRAIDRSRLDERFTDRLLSKKEYEDIFKKVPYIMTQSKINSAMKEIFYIDGK